ncbi:MAG: glycosyltransferase family 2 protein [Culicoidibacterales bacterium]
MLGRITQYLRKNDGVANSVKNFKYSIKRYGLKPVLMRTIATEEARQVFTYDNWITEIETKYNRTDVANEISSFNYMPKISILIPVYNVPEKYLRACIDSIVEQYYTNWELCLADDCSTQPHVKKVLQQYEMKDERIKVVFRKENGHISKATNSALEIATGEFIGFVDNDDILKPEALFEVVKRINEKPTVDMIYSDEDKLVEDTKQRVDPFFKPDWSPDTFMSQMYTCHFAVYRALLVQEIGGIRAGYEGAQDYDFVLRFTEKTQNIEHISKILYHWRIIPTSTASGSGAKNYAFEAAVRAKEDAIKRRKLNAYLVEDEQLGITSIQYNLTPDDLISIVIPTKNHGEDVKTCIESVYQKSTWKNFEIILVDNGSDDEASLAIFKELQIKYGITILDMPIPFNYSKLNNAAVAKAKGNLIMLLNNDTEIITPNWLEIMAGQAKQPHTGAVGAKLLYSDDTVQHAGVLGQLDGVAGHAFHNFHRNDYGYFTRAHIVNNYAAVTAACLMVEKQKFEQVNGLNEEHLTIAFNDVDFCFKLHAAGYYNVMRPDALLYHYESKSRGAEDTIEKQARFAKEIEYMRTNWAHVSDNDPFYNENLNRRHLNFRYNEPEKSE